MYKLPIIVKIPTLNEKDIFLVYEVTKFMKNFIYSANCKVKLSSKCPVKIIHCCKKK